MGSPRVGTNIHIVRANFVERSLTAASRSRETRSTKLRKPVSRLYSCTDICFCVHTYLMCISPVRLYLSLNILYIHMYILLVSLSPLQVHKYVCISLHYRRHPLDDCADRQGGRRCCLRIMCGSLVMYEYNLRGIQFDKLDAGQFDRPTMSCIAKIGFRTRHAIRVLARRWSSS